MKKFRSISSKIVWKHSLYFLLFQKCTKIPKTLSFGIIKDLYINNALVQFENHKDSLMEIFREDYLEFLTQLLKLLNWVASKILAFTCFYLIYFQKIFHSRRSLFWGCSVTCNLRHLELWLHGGNNLVPCHFW